MYCTDMNNKGVFWRNKRKKPSKENSYTTLSGVIMDSKKLPKRNKDDVQPNKPKGCVLVSYWELPDYMKDNEFILNYYRANWSIKEAFYSVFRLHNETINVWTHLIGLLLFVGLTVANVVDVPQLADLFGLFGRPFPATGETNISHTSNNILVGTSLIGLKHISSSNVEPMSTKNPATRWPFFVFLAGAMFCLLSSSICHLFSCHSKNTNLLLLRIDYAGIVVMIITSFFPPIYYVFQCDHAHWTFIYLGGISLMGLFTIIALLSPRLSSNKFRSVRALLFVSMGLFGIFPATHAMVVNWDNPQRNITVAYESAMALSYLIGTLFYVTRIPERWKPGWFDLAGHSHQIFHVLVVLGALAHYGATIMFLEWRDKVGCNEIKLL